MDLKSVVQNYKRTGSKKLQHTCNTKNHAAYISSWAKSVKNAKNPSQALMKVFSNSVKATNLIIGEQ